MDNAGFNEAINHLDDIYRTAFYMTKNQEDAEYLVQETYIKAYTAWDKFIHGANCKIWLFKILHDTRLDILEDNDKKPADQALDKKDPSKNEMSPVELKKHVETAFTDDIKKALTKIPSECLDALILHWAADFSYAEIASILNCPEEKAASLIYSARSILNKNLGDNWKIKHE